MEPHVIKELLQIYIETINRVYQYPSEWEKFCADYTFDMINI